MEDGASDEEDKASSRWEGSGNGQWDSEAAEEESDVEDGASDEEDKASGRWEGSRNGQWDSEAADSGEYSDEDDK